MRTDTVYFIFSILRLSDFIHHFGLIRIQEILHYKEAWDRLEIDRPEKECEGEDEDSVQFLSLWIMENPTPQKGTTKVERCCVFS